MLKKILIFFCIFLSTTNCSDQIENRINPLELWKAFRNFHNINLDYFPISKCSLQLAAYMKELSKPKPAKWALKMFDATSKMQSGLLSGNIRDMGAFDQCLSILNVHVTLIGNRDMVINGKHCYTILVPNEPTEMRRENIDNDTIRLNNLLAAVRNNFGIVDEADERSVAGTVGMMGLRWSVCAPEVCSAAQIEKFVQKNVFGKTSSIRIMVSDSKCHSAESIKPKLTSNDWGFISFMIAILSLMIASTLYDNYLRMCERKSPYPILLVFSVTANGERLLKVNNNPEQLPCLHGMRWFSMMWILLGHRYAIGMSSPLINAISLLTWQRKFSSQLELGSTVSVDTFFMLSGCLLMYGFLKAMSKKPCFNIFLFYLHRYLRLTPVLGIVIWFHITVLQYIGSGPRWPITATAFRDTCSADWWKMLLYVQNYVPIEGCIGQSWYLAIDMQLYWISPLIILPVWYFKRFARAYLITLTAIFVVVPTYIAYKYKLVSSGVDGSNADGTMEHDVYYIKTHTRAGTWIVGLYLGHLLFYTRGKKIVINMWLSTMLWTLSTVVSLYVLFGLYPTTQEGYEYSRWFSTFYIGFHRVAWCIALSWVVFACVHGYGGPANWILSLPMFQILGRLTYSMYLVHTTIQQMRTAVVRTPGYFSDLDTWYVFWGDLAFSMIVSVVLVLAFEYPIAIIDSTLLGGAKKPKAQAEKVDTKKDVPIDNQQNIVCPETTIVVERQENNTTDKKDSLPNAEQSLPSENNRPSTDDCRLRTVNQESGSV